MHKTWKTLEISTKSNRNIGAFDRVVVRLVFHFKQNLAKNQSSNGLLDSNENKLVNEIFCEKIHEKPLPYQRHFNYQSPFNQCHLSICCRGR